MFGRHLDFHQCSSGKFDAKFWSRVEEENERNDREESRKRQENLCEVVEDEANRFCVSFLLSLLLWGHAECSEVLANRRVSEERENVPRNHNCSEHGDWYSESKCDSKASHDRRSHKEQNCRGDDHRNIGIADGGPRMVERHIHSSREKLPFAEFLLHTFEDEDICIDRHPNAEDYSSDAGEREDDVLIREEEERKLEECKVDHGIDCKGEHGDYAQDPIRENHVDTNE